MAAGSGAATDLEARVTTSLFYLFFTSFYPPELSGQGDGFDLPISCLAVNFVLPAWLAHCFTASKSAAMRNLEFFEQPFSFDPSKLDDDQEICFDYDDQGRLVRIRKERRMDVLSIKILIWVGGILFLGLYIFLSVR